MNQKIFIATRNKGKAQEFARLLGSPWEIGTLLDFPSFADPQEDGATFEENARKKALHVGQLSLDYILADDSGLEVEALGGRPGVFSARYAGEPSHDQRNIEKLLEELKGHTQRKAQFVCVLILAQGERVLHMAQGICPGQIALQPQGRGGFGYDPIFIPEGYETSFGELSPEIKNQISHRAQACREMKLFLDYMLQSRE